MAYWTTVFTRCFYHFSREVLTKSRSFTIGLYLDIVLTCYSFLRLLYISPILLWSRQWPYCCLPMLNWSSHAHSQRNQLCCLAKLLSYVSTVSTLLQSSPLSPWLESACLVFLATSDRLLARPLLRLLVGGKWTTRSLPKSRTRSFSAD